MRRKTPPMGGGAEMVKQLGRLYGHSTAPAPTIKSGSIVTCDILPGERLEVIQVHDTAATLRLANGARLRIGLHRLVGVRDD